MITMDNLKQKVQHFNQQLQNALNLVQQYTGALQSIQMLINEFEQGVANNGQANNTKQK